MKKLVWKLITKFFSHEINNHTCLQENSIFNKLKEREDAKSVISNYPVGTRVIIRSNEPGPLFIGDVIGHSFIPNHRKIYLTIKDENGKVICPLDSTPAIWTPEREAALNKLSWDEQWNAMSKFHYVISQETKTRKEAEAK